MHLTGFSKRYGLCDVLHKDPTFELQLRLSTLTSHGFVHHPIFLLVWVHFFAAQQDHLEQVYLILEWLLAFMLCWRESGMIEKGHRIGICPTRKVSEPTSLSSFFTVMPSPFRTVNWPWSSSSPNPSIRWPFQSSTSVFSSSTACTRSSRAMAELILDNKASGTSIPLARSSFNGSLRSPFLRRSYQIWSALPEKTI